MKPSWDEAPEWANWLAMDDTGGWWWYETEPIPVGVSGFFTASGGKCTEAVNDFSGWLDTLERRP